MAGVRLRGVSHQFRVPELRRRLAVLRVRGYVNTMTNRPEVFVVSGVTPDDVRTWYEVPETVAETVRRHIEQVEAVLDGGSTCSDGGSEGYRRALEAPLLVLSQTGMQRG
jgi:hypothetical protein